MLNGATRREKSFDQSLRFENRTLEFAVNLFIIYRAARCVVTSATSWISFIAVTNSAIWTILRKIDARKSALPSFAFRKISSRERGKSEVNGYECKIAIGIFSHGASFPLRSLAITLAGYSPTDSFVVCKRAESDELSIDCATHAAPG